jgi:alkyldihydroxyacetonephosphate synthase
MISDIRFRIATRSSGIKQNDYGNIDKIVIKVKVVTSIGTFEKVCTPRSSMGPEIDTLMFGSEGTLGVITEAVVRIHKYPEVKQYGALLFPTFEIGVQFMKEAALQKCVPSSLRLVDNIHIKYGLGVTFHKNLFAEVFEQIRLFVVKHLVNENEYCIASYLIEGEKKQAMELDRNIREIGSKFGAWVAGPSAGERAYFVTFTVGYLRVSH